MPNITNITPPRVPIVDPETGFVTREWFRFFYNLFYLTGSGQNDWTIDDLRKSPQDMSAEAFAQINTLYNAALSMPSSGAAELSASINGLTQQLQTQPRDELGTMAAVQQDNVRYMRFSNYPSPAPGTTDVGTVYWDGGTTMNVVMTPHVVQPVGESQYYYIKCSEAAGVKRGQVIMFDGAVGASNQLKGKLATGLTSGDYLMGVAAEDIAFNGFGMVASFGTVASLGSQKIDTSAWPLGTILYYDPTTPGGLTSTLPSAPNVKATIAAVTESSKSGSIFVRVSFGSKLGETDSNVQFTALADKNIIQYDSALGYWKNVAPSSVVVGTATNLAGGAAGSIPYQTAPDTTTFLPIGTARSVLQTNAGTTAAEWVDAPIFGSTATTDGVQLFSGYYTAGQVAVWGGEFSNGGPVTGYAVKPNTTTVGGFLSTTPNNLARTAYTLRNGSHSWYYAPAQTVAVNGAITGVVEAMKLDSTGLSIATGYSYQINGTSVLDATTLGSGVVNSSLTSVGTIGTGVWNGTKVAVAYGGTGATTASITAFNNITGYTASGATGTTSTNLVFSTSPTLTTPKATTTIGVGNATAASSGAGISFPATASGSSDVNTLDDYEEGTFTPTYQAATTDFTSITYDVQTGRYTKIGNMVQVTIQLRTTNVDNTGAAGTLRIAGLPFTSTSGAGSVGSGVGYATNFNSNYPLSINYTANSTTVDLYYRSTVTGATVINTYVDIKNGASAASNYLAVTFTYRTAA